jgi:hypothetical protein
MLCTRSDFTRRPELLRVRQRDCYVDVARFGRSELCPRLCPNECLLPTNTVTYGETPRDMFRVLSR